MHYKQRMLLLFYGKAFALFMAISATLYLSIVFFLGRVTDSTVFFVSTTISKHNSWFYQLVANTYAFFLYYLGSTWFFIIFCIGTSAWMVYHDEPLHKQLITYLLYGLAIIALGSWQALYDFNLIYSPFACGGYVGHASYALLSKFLDLPLRYVVINLSVVMLLMILFRVPLLMLSRLMRSLCSDYRVRAVMRYGVYFVNALLRFVMHNIKRYAYYVRNIISGAYIAESGQSLRAFEFDEIVYEALAQARDDTRSNTHDTGIDNDLFLTEKSIVQVEKKDAHASDNRMLDDQQVLDQDTSLFITPPASLWKHFAQAPESKHETKDREEIAQLLEQKLERFGIKGCVVTIKKGPVVTLFEYQPHIDSKLSKIIALEDDLALALRALSIRIIAPIPGKSVVGFEVANTVRSPVLFSTLAQSPLFVESSAFLPLILGVDTTGNPVVDDLARMPHLLLAGATGSGKSVALHAMIMSLLCRVNPDELNLILIDPKRLEFFCYQDIPHLIFPVATQAKDIAGILRWVVKTMEERYQILSAAGVRDIHEYNRLCAREKNREKISYLVVVIDELADLMMVAGKEIEDSIIRIAQMARASGIHMIVATQRPSVDIITGTIKVNFPTRISCKVSSKIDSRTILDCIGADKLLGKGDMLYLNSSSLIARVHGAYVSDDEIKTVVNYLKTQRGVNYQSWIEEGDEDAVLPDEDKKLFDDVVHFIQSIDKVSISLLQRRFKIGYNRSARIIEMLESHGYIVHTQDGRKVVRS